MNKTWPMIAALVALQTAWIQAARAHDTLQFGATEYSATEGARSASFDVTRIGSNQGSISVQYTTGDGSATAGEDYSAASGSLTWENGDATSKLIIVYLQDDDIAEGDETINVIIFNPKDADLGDPSACVLTLKDNDACKDGETLRCYSGPDQTEDVGVCHGGLRTCASETWGECADEMTPQAEDCGDELDNDCDDLTDEADTEDCAEDPDAGTDAGADGSPDAGADSGTDAGADPGADEKVENKDGGGCSSGSTPGRAGVLWWVLTLGFLLCVLKRRPSTD